ncbi:glycosyltransferase family 2 protein [Halomicrobium mukohataei]|nr:glycosyltransferase family 2 protein [Halomicrobium mukohataei]
MSENVYEQNQSSSAATAEPGHAVGFVATEKNTEALLRAILRAQERGYDVFVATLGESDGESTRFAKQLGAKVVPLRTDELAPETLRRCLSVAAEEADFSSLLIHPDIEKRIDYDRSAELLDSEDFCIDAAIKAEASSDALAPEIVVGIPAYNEEQTIASVVEKSLPVADEVLVVDDGSQDETATLAAAAGATVIEHETNSGYGAALQTTFEEAHTRNADRLVVIDADGQHDPTDIPRIVEAQKESESELVIGSRFADDGDTDAPLYRRFGLTIVNLLTNLSFGVIRPRSWVSDTQSGFRAYNQRAIESLATDDGIGNNMSASTDILHHAHSNGYEVEEVGTTIDYDVENASNQHPVSHGITLVSNILQTVEHERPITSLGIPGFLSSFVGLGFGYWTFSNYIASGTFPMGLAITSAFFGLAGIFACFTAIILHSLKQHLDD